MKALPKTPIGPMRAPARALGWFSIGVGLTELALPRTLARAAGMPNVPALTRIHGLRELGTGIGILTSRDPSPWLWARVAGDALGVATVGAGLVTAGRPLRTLTSMALLLGIAWVDMRVAEGAPADAKLRRHSGRDYSKRSELPRPAHEMRGIARKPSSRLADPAPATVASTPDASPARTLMQASETTKTQR